MFASGAGKCPASTCAASSGWMLASSSMVWPLFASLGVIVNVPPYVPRRIASVPVLFAGTHLGAWAFRRSHPRHHRLIALMLLSVLAVMLIARALARW